MTFSSLSKPLVLACFAGFCVILWGLGPSSAPVSSLDTQGAGDVLALGDGRHHVQLLAQEDQQIALLLSGASATVPAEMAQRPVDAYIEAENAAQAIPITFVPAPLPGDTPGMTSHLTAKLPEGIRAGGGLRVTVPEIQLEDQRYRISMVKKQEKTAHAPQMPEKVADAEELELYLTPGGIYTEADIEANGRLTASQRFLGFRSAHDDAPQVGDLLCPITSTKAHVECTWVVAGETYGFCCPPCVDEFVTWAKNEPERILPLSAYVKR